MNDFELFPCLLEPVEKILVDGADGLCLALILGKTDFSRLIADVLRLHRAELRFDRSNPRRGHLEIVLQRLADIMEKQQELKARIQTAMAYPILMTAVGTLVLFFLMTFVVPNITTIFEDMNQALPPPTRFLMAASGLFKSYWWLLVVLTVAALVALKIFRKSVPRRQHRYFSKQNAA